MKYKTRKERRWRRHLRVRRKVHGTAERPRMSITISNRHQIVQFIDDDRGVTLASVTTQGMENVKNNVGMARQLGRRAAEVALARGIRRVVVDRGGHRFHGRVRAIVEAAVEGGLRIRAEDEDAVAAEAQPARAGEST